MISGRPSLAVSRTSANLLLLLAATFWGLGNVAQKTVLEHIDAFSAVGLRCLIAALLVVPFAFYVRSAKQTGYWPSLLKVSALFSVSIALQQTAYLDASVTNASFLVNTATVMTPIAAWLLLGERPLVAVGFAALATLVGVLLLSGGLETATMGRGDVTALLSAVCYALWMVQLGSHMQKYGDALTAATAQFALAAAITMPVGIAIGGLAVSQIADAAPELLILGVFSTAAAFGIQTLAQRFTSASHAAVIVSAESVFGAAGAAMFLGERLSTSGMVGAAIVLAAIVYIASMSQDPTVRKSPA